MIIVYLKSCLLKKQFQVSLEVEHLEQPTPYAPTSSDFESVNSYQTSEMTDPPQDETWALGSFQFQTEPK